MDFSLSSAISQMILVGIPLILIVYLVIRRTKRKSGK